MDEQIKISVIVPVYNVERYISQAIESVIRQTYNNWELLLIDDGSTDESGQIIDKYSSNDSRIKSLHQTNKGASAARNLGIEHASGKFFFFLDSDDYLPSDALMHLISHQKKADADMVIGDFELGVNGKIYPYKHPACYNKVQFINDFLASFWVIIWGSLVKASIFVKNNIRFPEGVIYSEDFYTILLVLLSSGRIINCRHTVYHYNRDNELSVTHQECLTKITNERDIYLRCLSLLKDKGLLNLYEKPLAWRLLKIEQALIYNSDYFENFRINYPLKMKYIASCPFISMKMRLLMWLVSKKCDKCARALLKMRGTI